MSNELLIHLSLYFNYADEISAFSRTCRLLYSLVNPLIFPRYAKQHQVDAILYAMENGDHALMEKLIKAGVELVTYVSETQHSLIATAASDGHLGMVRVLLDMTKEDVHCIALYDHVPLVGALLHGHLDTAQFLVSRGALPDFKSTMDEDRTALSLIAEKGSLASVKFLVEETFSDIEARDSKGYTPLLYAASHGSLEILKYLIQAGADPTVTDNQGKNILLHAAQRDRTEMSHFLLSMARSDHLLGNIDGMSLAHIASEGRGQTANLLLKRMDHNAVIASADRCDDLVPYLFSGAACGLDSLVQHLLEKGCDPLAKVLLEKDQTIDDEPIYHKYDNPLRQAAANGHISTVQLLLNSIHMHDSSKLGSSIVDIIPIAAENNASQLLQNVLDNNKIQQLDRAVLKNCVSEALKLSAPYEGIIHLLVNYGATPDQQSDGGFKFLQQVVKQGSCSSIKLLLDVTGLNPLQTYPFTPDHRHFTSLLETAASHSDLQMVKQLLEAGNVDFRPTNEECQQALSSALSWYRFDTHKSLEIIKYFLDHGFDVNCKARRGCYAGVSLLSIAASMPERHQDMTINILLKYGANVHITDDMQRTALWWAVTKWNHNIVQILLDHGADPLQKDKDGRTPLYESMSWYTGAPFKTVLRGIEARGAKFDFNDIMQKAERRGYDEHEENRIVKYLLQHQCRVMYPCT